MAVSRLARERSRNVLLVALGLAVLAGAAPLRAAEEPDSGEAATTELAKKTQNPVADLPNQGVVTKANADQFTGEWPG